MAVITTKNGSEVVIINDCFNWPGSTDREIATIFYMQLKQHIKLFVLKSPDDTNGMMTSVPGVFKCHLPVYHLIKREVINQDESLISFRN